MKKGIVVQVFRPADFPQCTLDGPSSQFSRFTLIDPQIPGYSEPTADAPEINLISRSIGGRVYFHAVPASQNGLMTSAGGNFIYSPDSRFREVCPYPISIHDRDMAKERLGCD
jgi:hypothetical protein